MDGLIILAVFVIGLAVLGALAVAFGADSRAAFGSEYEDAPGLI
jgi:fructose-specific phosphotransferase system IIC component